MPSLQQKLPVHTEGFCFQPQGVPPLHRACRTIWVSYKLPALVRLKANSLFFLLIQLLPLQGLRTLAVAARILDEDEYTKWDEQFQEAAALLDGRDDAIEKLIAEARAVCRPGNLGPPRMTAASYSPSFTHF